MWLPPAVGSPGARRLPDDAPEDCAEQRYLLVPTGLQNLGEGDAASAYTAFSQAAEICGRLGDWHLTAFGQPGQCQALIVRGEVAEGVALLDEAMIAVTAERSLAQRLTGCRLLPPPRPCRRRSVLLHIIATMAASRLHSRRLG